MTDRISASTRLCAFLVRPRGDVVWSGIVHATGVAGAAALAALLVVPRLAPLIGFVVVTVWVNGPWGMFLPATYEPILIAFGRVYPPWLIAFLGVLGAGYIEYLNYQLYVRVLESRALSGVMTSRGVGRVAGWFAKAPFFTVWLCSWSPLPYWAVRILSPMAGYPVRRHLVATVLGRFPRLWFFAALGAYWKIDLGYLFSLSIVAIAVPLSLTAVTAVRSRRKRRRVGGVSEGPFGAPLPAFPPRT